MRELCVRWWYDWVLIMYMLYMLDMMDRVMWGVVCAGYCEC